MILPYGWKYSLLVIGGILLYHIAVFCLCAFWIYRFIIFTYDPTVFILLFMFAGLTIFLDVLLGKYKIFVRFLTYYTIDLTGITYVYLRKRQHFLWNEMQSMGIVGHSSPYKEPIAFFSKNPNEYIMSILQDWTPETRIVFRTKRNDLEKMCKYIPDNIKNKLRQAMSVNNDCILRIN